MAGTAVFLGAWLTDSPLSFLSISLLSIASILATGFGNVINDIQDIETDRISHPERPLPKGEMSLFSARAFALILIVITLTASFSVSKAHGSATLIPLILLLLYALILKGTPIAGNLLVASLVAYSILYGAIGSPLFTKLLIPAALAFLLNFSREIIKDIQDHKGDMLAGYKTSATLPRPVLRGIVYGCSFSYLLLILLPYFKKDTGLPYLLVCVLVALPLHIYRTVLISNKNWESRTSLISKLFKFEMLVGLGALAIDKI
jgi:geranylgeranylglycerol-phosphate geranylgeranyltransferase